MSASQPTSTLSGPIAIASMSGALAQVGHVAPAIGGARLLTQPAGLHTGHSGDLMGMEGGTRKDKGGMWKVFLRMLGNSLDKWKNQM